jgi:cysteine desulfurase
MIYLDNNATTQVAEEVIAAMRQYLVSEFVNPASPIGHFLGVDRAIVAQKSKLARILGIESASQLIITSGATESNNLAILGAAKCQPERRHLIVSAIEHPSVLEVADYLQRVGYRVTRLPVGADGVVARKALEAALADDTLLVSVMLANNETGVLQPVEELAATVKEADPAILFHTDATQAVGKCPVDLEAGLPSVDFLSFSAHKFHGPKGVGGLFVREADSLCPISYGGGQQFGLRPGTENPAAIAAMSAALTMINGRDFAPVAKLRDFAEGELLGLCPGARILGREAKRLPNTFQIHIPGADGDEMVDAFAVAGVAVSTGSACAHGARKPSHVATAMGLSYLEAQQCIRVSLAFNSTERDINEFLGVSARVLESRHARATPAR